MKKLMLLAATLLFAAALATVAVSGETTYTLTGLIVSVDRNSNTVTVHSTEGVTAAADNRWKGDVPFIVDSQTKIMGEDGGSMTIGDLQKGQNVMVKFHESGKQVIADQISISPKVLPRPY